MVQSWTALIISWLLASHYDANPKLLHGEPCQRDMFIRFLKSVCHFEILLCQLNAILCQFAHSNLIYLYIFHLLRSWTQNNINRNDICMLHFLGLIFYLCLFFIVMFCTT